MFRQIIETGIDVEVDVEHRGQRRRCERMGFGRHSGGGRHWGLHMRGGGFGGPWGMRGRGGGWGWGCGRGRGGGRPGMCPWRQTYDGAEEPTGSENAAAGTDQQQQAGTGENQQQPTAMSQGQAKQQETINAETGEKMNAAPQSSSTPDNGWMLVNDTEEASGDVERATDGVRNLDVSDGGNPDLMTFAASQTPGVYLLILQ